MIEFKLPDMTCGHCAGRVTQALKGADAECKVAIDLKTRTAQVESRAERSELAAALADAGYPPA